MRVSLWSLSVANVVLLTLNILLMAETETLPRRPTNIFPAESKSLYPQQPTQLQQHPPATAEAPTPPPCLPAPADSPAAASIFRVDVRLGRWDARHLYKMYDYAVVGDRYAELSSQFTVCLATQGSIEKLKSLVQVAHQWSGPISAALYAAGDDEYTLLQIYVAYLRRCFPAVRERVSFHLAFPKDRAPHHLEVEAAAAAVLEPPLYPHVECLRPQSALQDLLRARSAATAAYRAKVPCAQNHLRNLARRNCQTAHVFLTDVDIVPSARLAEGLDVFLRGARCDGLCAYVIPTYELHEHVRLPKNKTELLLLTEQALARPFNQIWRARQFATDFKRWQASADTESSAVHVSHKVTNFEFLYEPFYVAPDTAPAHDERFMGYGFTRNTQVYEMHLAGYNFHVLSPVFTCHWGMNDDAKRGLGTKWQIQDDERLLQQFKKEVSARYTTEPGLPSKKPQRPLRGTTRSATGTKKPQGVGGRGNASSAA